MEKEARINIIGTQIVDGDPDTVELMTLGKFYKKEGSYYISYVEKHEDASENCKVILKFTGEEKVVITRGGKYPSHMMLESKRRNMCQYSTPYGNLMLGISSAEIENHLTSKGGEASLKYSIDVNAELLSEHELKIKVEQGEKICPIQY